MSSVGSRTTYSGSLVTFLSFLKVEACMPQGGHRVLFTLYNLAYVPDKNFKVVGKECAKDSDWAKALRVSFFFVCFKGVTDMGWLYGTNLPKWESK